MIIRKIFFIKYKIWKFIATRTNQNGAGIVFRPVNLVKLSTAQKRLPVIMAAWPDYGGGIVLIYRDKALVELRRILKK